MEKTMLHIWRNSPLGRENLLQAIYFCRKAGGLRLAIYRPISAHGLMYFDTAAVAIDLDASYLVFPKTSEQHLRELLDEAKVPWQFVEPDGFTASTLPNIPGGWDAMSCPRAISDSTSRVGLGHIGPKVRAIVKHADFPILIPGGSFKPWQRVACLFGGSELGVRAVKMAMRIADHAQVPLTVYSQLSRRHREKPGAALSGTGFPIDGRDPDRKWVTFDEGRLAENLYAIAHDSLVVLGAGRERLVRQLLLGSKLELVQSTLPNPLLVIGPQCQKAL